ncbi:hypothetical protein GCM10028820_17080 [Tessaracoccus terricola]
MVELSKTYPMPVHVLVLRYLTSLLLRTAAVCGALSLVVLVVGIAVEEGALGLERDVARGIDTFMRKFMGVVALGGVFGVLVIAAVVHDVFRREQRNALDALVDDGIATKEELPVEWQRSALGAAGVGSWILSAFAVVIGPVGVIASFMTLADGDTEFGFWALGVSAVIAVAGVLGIRALLRPKPSSAAALWENEKPTLHPQEPGPGQKGKQAASREGLEHAPPILRRLDRLDRAAWRAMGIAGALLTACAVVIVALTLLRKPCRNCDKRFFGPGLEGFIDVSLVVAVVLLLAGLVVLVSAAAMEGWVTLRLRGAVVAIAADRDSEAPPWFLLRRLLLEESPMQALTGHLHTLGIACLAFGVTGSLVTDVYPFTDWTAVYPALCTVGGVLLLFHLSGWFFKREETRAQNEALLARWPK